MCSNQLLDLSEYDYELLISLPSDNATYGIPMVNDVAILKVLIAKSSLDYLKTLELNGLDIRDVDYSKVKLNVLITG